MPTRRTLLGLGGLVAIGAAAGCSKSNSGGSGSAMTAIWWGDASVAKETNDVIAIYDKEAAPNSVKGQFLAYDDYFDKLATLAAAKNLPDLMAFNGDNLPKYAANGLLMDIGDVNLGDYDRSGLTTGKYKGKLYGVNFATEYVIMMYNQKLAQGTGVAIPADGSSWDDWATYFADLQTKLPTGVYAADDLSGNENVFLSWLIGRGAEGIWAANGGIGFDAEDAQTWFQYWADLRDKKVVPPGPQSLAASQAGGFQNDPVTKGKAVYSADTITDFPGDQSINPQTMSLASCPVGPKARGEWHSFYGWAVSASAPEKPAKDFLHLWFTNPEAWKAVGFSHGVPVSQDALDTLSKGATGANRTILDLLDKKYPVKPVQIPGAPASLGSKFDTAYTQAVQAIWSGSSTLDAAIKQFMSDSEAAFAGN